MTRAGVGWFTGLHHTQDTFTLSTAIRSSPSFALLNGIPCSIKQVYSHNKAQALLSMTKVPQMQALQPMLAGNSVVRKGAQNCSVASLAQKHSIHEAWAQLKVLIKSTAELQINVYLCLATPSLPMLHPSYRYVLCAQIQACYTEDPTVANLLLRQDGLTYSVMVKT